MTAPDPYLVHDLVVALDYGQFSICGGYRPDIDYMNLLEQAQAGPGIASYQCGLEAEGAGVKGLFCLPVIPIRHHWPVDVDLRLIRYFIVVAEHGNFHRAAAALRTAQPSLSRQIQQLEKVLGVRLFERTRQAVTSPPRVKRSCPRRCRCCEPPSAPPTGPDPRTAPARC